MSGYLTPAVFPANVDMNVTEQLIGFHSFNPFVTTVSSARSYMSSSHMSQAVVLNNGEEKIIQSGLEYQLGENTFSKKVLNDSRVIQIIKRYDGASINYANELTAVVIILEDLVTQKIDYIELPYYFSLHQYFGFKYVWNLEVLRTLNVGSFIPGGTILADSPAVTKNSGYKFGINANIAYISTPEVSEDGVIISKSMAKKLSYKVYERRVVDFGSESFALNTYGDKDNYKAFPDIGEYVNKDSVLMVLREYRSDLVGCLTSINDVTEFNPIFDKAIYVKSPKSKVVDIKCHYNPKFKKDIYTGTIDGVAKYANGFKKYHRDLVTVYEKLQKEHYSRHRGSELPISEKLHRLLVDSYVFTDESNNIKLKHKKQPLDIYRIEFVLETEVVVGPGAKVTTTMGSKGVVVGIYDDDKMPIDPLTGLNVDMCMDPTSIPGRMNIGNLYEQYFCSMSRHTKQLVINEISRLNTPIDKLNDTDLNSVFNIVLGLTEIIDTEQHGAYVNTSRTERIEILREIVETELFIYYKVTSKKRPYQVVCDVKGTMYEPKKTNVVWNKDGKSFVTKNQMMVGPQYVILLAKTPENYLSCASPRTNHYGFPIGVSSKQRVNLPWRNSPVRILSETETRLYAAYAGRKAIIEIKDRANSLKTHEYIYRYILDAPVPTNIKNVVDRNVCPYGGDSAIEFVENILNAAGVDVQYVEDPKKIHPEIV